jgi:hypothetical protein
MGRRKEFAIRRIDDSRKAPWAGPKKKALALPKLTGQRAAAQLVNLDSPISRSRSRVLPVWRKREHGQAIRVRLPLTQQLPGGGIPKAKAIVATRGSQGLPIG